MLNSNQIAHGNNGFEDTTSRECEGLHEEIFEDINKENSVIDNLESKIEDLQQENFDLKRNLGLHKHYKKIAEEDNEVVIELTRKIQTLEGEIKMLKVTMEKDEREKRNICEEIERLEQQREELKGDLENKVSRINALKKKLKDQKDDIHFMNITNKKLNQDLDQDKALINRLKEQLGEKEKQPEDLIKNLTDGNKYLQEIGYLRDNLNQKKLKNQDLIEELNRLQKAVNEDIKLKTLHPQPGRSLLDELDQADIKADKLTKTENDCDKGGYSQESDLGYASLF